MGRPSARTGIVLVAAGAAVLLAGFLLVAAWMTGRLDGPLVLPIFFMIVALGGGLLLGGWAAGLRAFSRTSA